MTDFLECRGCRSFHWIPGCGSGGQIIRCAHVIKPPAGIPCPGFWPNNGPPTPKPDAPEVKPRETPLLVDKLAEAVRRLLVLRFALDPQVIFDREFAEAALARYQQEVGHDQG